MPTGIPSMDANARPSTVSLRQRETTAANAENALTRRNGKAHIERRARAQKTISRDRKRKRIELRLRTTYNHTDNYIYNYICSYTCSYTCRKHIHATETLTQTERQRHTETGT